MSSFSFSNILSYLYILNKRKSCGNDGVNRFLLQNCASSFAHSLESIFKNSITSGKLPQAWKEANVSPIFKKVNKQKPTTTDNSSYWTRAKLWKRLWETLWLLILQTQPDSLPTSPTWPTSLTRDNLRDHRGQKLLFFGRISVHGFCQGIR